MKKLLQVTLSQEVLDLYTQKVLENADKLQGLQVNIEEQNLIDITAKVKAGFLPVTVNGKAELQENVHMDLDDKFKIKLTDFNFILRLLAPLLNSEKSQRMGIEFNMESITVSMKQFFANSNLSELNQMISNIAIQTKKGQIKLKAMGQAKEEEMV